MVKIDRHGKAIGVVIQTLDPDCDTRKFFPPERANDGFLAGNLMFHGYKPVADLDEITGITPVLHTVFDWKAVAHWKSARIDIQRTHSPARRKAMRLCLTPHC